MTGEFRPDWRVHPGEVLREVLTERKVRQTHLARRMGVSVKHVNWICQGRAGITAPIAVRLERVLGRPHAEFWMNLQVSHDLHKAREEVVLPGDGDDAVHQGDVPAA